MGDTAIAVNNPLVNPSRGVYTIFYTDWKCGLLLIEQPAIIAYFGVLVFISIRDSIDYKDPTFDQMEKRILKKLRPGSITLFHSGAKNTPGALPQIIRAIRAQGYEFVPVSELIHPAPYTVDFEGRQHPMEPAALGESGKKTVEE